MNNIESGKGEIVMYQPDETIRLEVRVEGETVFESWGHLGMGACFYVIFWAIFLMVS